MKRLACLALAGLLVTVGTTPAQVDHGKVQEAIQKGADYLKKFQVGRADGGGGTHAAGLASLVGVALLEAGVPHTDPTVAAIVEFVRSVAFDQDQTYDVSLIIVFLDRLNDPSDVPLIQVLGCRLLYGQNNVGGWRYQCWTSSADDARVRKAVGVKDPKLIRPEPRPDPNAPPATPPKLHPEAFKIYQVIRAGKRMDASSGYGGDDNSNTQFAIVGMWVAQRRGVPCRAAIRAIDNRFMKTQSPADHGWAYGLTPGSSPSMTCAGLLGLAVAAAADAGKLPSDRVEVGVAADQKAKPRDDDPFFNPPDGKGGGDPDAPTKEEEEEQEEKRKVNPFREAAIKRGLEALGRLLKGNAAAGRGGAEVGGIKPGGMVSGWGGVSDLYFFWSLERVGVAFGIDTIGTINWYDWGAAQILRTQNPDGSWAGNFDASVNTSFAILFLARSNFVSDLSAKIKGKVKDPGAAELTGTRGGILGLSGQGSTEAVRTPGSGGAVAAPGQGPGDLTRIQNQTMAEKLAEALIKANDKQWPDRLRNARDETGGQYTAAMVSVAGQLDGKRQYQAREALAERLTRMTVDTLRRYLKDRDSELRRAACLACAMKDEKAHVPDLIDRVLDVDESVIRAAKAGLKSMTGKDFGPPAEATDEQKTNALKDWLQWYALEGRGR